MAKAKGSPKTGGRTKGSLNKRTLDGEAYAKAIVEDADGRNRLLESFQQGTMPPQVLLHLLQLAYGKPTELLTYASTNGHAPTSYYLTPVTASPRDAGTS